MLRGISVFILRPCPITFVLAGIFQFLQGSGRRKMVHSRRFSLFFMQSHGRDIYFTAQCMHERTDGPREEGRGKREKQFILGNPPFGFNWWRPVMGIGGTYMLRSTQLRNLPRVFSASSDLRVYTMNP